MKQVDIIMSSRITHIGGPMGTMKRILKNKEYFEKRGYHVSIFTFESVELGPFEDISQIPNKQQRTRKPSFRMKLSSYLRKYTMKNRILTVLSLRKTHKRTEKLINYYLSLKRSPDIVQLHSHYDGSYYYKMQKNKEVKFVVFLHSNGIPYDQELCTYPLLPQSVYYKTIKKMLDNMISKATFMGFIANKGQSNFLKIYHNRSKYDTVVVRNGIDDLDQKQLAIYDSIKNNTKSNFKYRLCTVGTISYRKGQRLIIETLHTLPEEILKEIHVDFVGDGPERPLLESTVVEYGLSDHVSFCGGVPNAEVYKHLAKNNIYILMSKNEGLPISVLEAMRVGLPIISTNVSGIPECVEDGYNGVLLEPDDKEQLTTLFRRLSEYDWEKMGIKSKKKFQKDFTFDRMKMEFCDLYDRIITNK